MTHYFIAIPIPRELQPFYFVSQERLKKDFSFKKWVHPEDFHITLKFLGEISDVKLSFLKEKLELVIQNKPFPIYLESIDFFGKHIAPRVLFVNVRMTNALLELQRKVEQITVDLGFPKESRPYRPHVTLAKKWNSDKKLQQLTKTDFYTYVDKEQSFIVNEIGLFRILQKSPSYEEATVIRFNKS